MWSQQQPAPQRRATTVTSPRPSRSSRSVPATMPMDAAASFQPALPIRRRRNSSNRSRSQLLAIIAALFTLALASVHHAHAQVSCYSSLPLFGSGSSSAASSLENNAAGGLWQQAPAVAAPGGLVVLLRDQPVPRPGNLTHLQLRVRSPLAPFRVQLWRACADETSPSAPLCLIASQLHSPSAAGLIAIPLSPQWMAQTGDVLGLAVASGVQLPIRLLNTTHAFMPSLLRDASVALFDGLSTWGQSSRLTHASFRRDMPAHLPVQITWTQPADQACPSANSITDACVDGPVLNLNQSAISNLTAGWSGVTTLLSGRPFAVADHLVAVQISIALNEPRTFDLQLWRPTAPRLATPQLGSLPFDSSRFLHTLVRSVRVAPVSRGVMSVPLDWAVEAGDVVGISGDSNAVASLAAVDEQWNHQPLPEAQLLQLPTATYSPSNQTASLGSTADFQQANVAHRAVGIRFALRTVCAARRSSGWESLSAFEPAALSVQQGGMIFGASVLRPISASDNPYAPVVRDPAATTTVLTGRPIRSNGTLVEVRLYASTLDAFTLQLLTLDTSAPLLQPVLSRQQVVQAERVGLLRVSLGWRVREGDLLAISSQAGSPVFFHPQELAATNGDDIAQAAFEAASACEVRQYSEVNEVVGQALSSEASASILRLYNLRVLVLADGWCAGAPQLVEHASLGSCGLLHATLTSNWCRLQCAPRFVLQGDSYLRCNLVTSADNTQSWTLTGSQRCVPLPCTLPLGSWSNATLGSCAQPLASGSECSLGCDTGSLVASDPTARCVNGALQTQFTGCISPRSCTLPGSTPTGASLGSCSAGGQLAHEQTCILEALTGYEAVSGSLDLRCFNGELSALPRLLREPCTLPPMASNVLDGDCPDDGLLQDGQSCTVQCARSHKQDDGATSASFSCSHAVLSGDMPTCRLAPSCILPDELRSGLAWGSCRASQPLSADGGGCSLAVATGYKLAADSAPLSLTCQLGVMSSLPTPEALSCTLPPLPASAHALAGDCPIGGARELASGASCQSQCEYPFHSSDAASFACFLGTLTGAWPTCRLPVCTLPLEFAEGVDSGSCTAGGQLRAEDNVLPSNCTLKLQNGFSLLSGSLDVECSRNGTLTALPSAAEALTPQLVTSGVCSTANSATIDSTAIMALRHTGRVICPVGAAMQGWLLERCVPGSGLDPSGTGMQLQLQCVSNLLFAPLNASQPIPYATVTGSCRTDSLTSLAEMTGRAFLTCPDNHAAVGMHLEPVQCGAKEGMRLSLYCLPLVSELAQRGRTGNYSARLEREYSSIVDQGLVGTAARDLTGPTARAMRVTPCPASSNYNYMRGLLMSGWASVPGNPRLITNALCVEFEATTVGMVAAPTRWFGPTALPRSELPAEKDPHCLVLPVIVLQSSGMLSAVRFYAGRTGPLTLQTYLLVGGEYIVQGSYEVAVAMTGAQVLSLPPAARWPVDPDHYFGFCYGDTPIVPGETVPTMPGGDYSAVIGFKGVPAGVGKPAGGGGEAGKAVVTQRFYPLQVAVAPHQLDISGNGASSAQQPSTSLGWSLGETTHSEYKQMDSTCYLMDSPRLLMHGRVTGFRFRVRYNTGGIVVLATYRPVTDPDTGTEQWRLVGSFQPATVKQGSQSVQVPAAEQWDVQPGDVLANCHTYAGLTYEENGRGLAWDQTWFGPWGRPVSQYDAGAQWWNQYKGGIQRFDRSAKVPQLVLGEFQGGSARTYSLQIQIQPTLSCKAEPTQARSGHGSVRCNARTCVLTCDAGWAAAFTKQQCQADGSWSPQGLCLSMSPPTLQQSWQLPLLSQYSLRVEWAPPASLPWGVSLVGWELSWSTLFPDNSDLQLKALAGVFNQSTGLQSLPPDVRAFQHTADPAGTVEHTTARFRLRMVTSGGKSEWKPLVTQTMCACQLARSLSISQQAALFGSPLDLHTKQLTDANNLMQLTFTPNSLCSDAYQVVVRAADGTPLDVEPVSVNTFHAESTRACSALQKPTQIDVSNVKYPMHGRPLSVCLRTQPMQLCGDCSSSYQLGLSGDAPEVCVETLLAFVLPIDGKVRAGMSGGGSRVAQGVSDVTVHAQLFDPDTLEPILLWDPAQAAYVNITARGVTDKTGSYAFQVESRLLSRQSYLLRVWPERVDYDPASGLSFAHTFQSLQNSPNDYFETVAGHMDMALNVEFLDQSSVPVLGQVLLPSGKSDNFYGSRALAGCGVRDVVVRAYRVSDTTFSSPLGESAATQADGSFALSVPIFQRVVLVPTHNSASNHTFDPPTMAVQVRSSMLQVEPFLDRTVASIQLTLSGGLCRLHVGSVRPTVFYDACGLSASILLPAFAAGDAALSYVYTLPAVPFTVKLYDAKNPFSGLQAVDTDGSRLPAAYLNGDLFSFVALRTSPFAVDLSVVPAEPVAFDFSYRAQPSITTSSAAECSDPQAAPGKQEYRVVASSATGKVKFLLEETYGYQSVLGEDKRRVCSQVESGVELLDGVSEAGAALFEQYVSGGCSTGSEICAVPSFYNPNTTETSVEYTFTAGSIQQSEWADPAGGRLQPAYSRVLQYRVQGSVLPWARLYYVVVGTLAYPGAQTLPFPRQFPLYILRDPPGGGSTASLSSSRTLTSTVSLTYTDETTSHVDTKAYFGARAILHACGGFKGGSTFPGPSVLIPPIPPSTGSAQAAVEVCIENVVDAKIRAQIGIVRDDVDMTSLLQQQVLNVGFTQDIATSSDPSVVDGEGDLFLTIDSTYSVSSAVTVEVKFEPIEGGGGQRCLSRAFPSTAWSLDKGASFEWVSAWDIKHTLFHEFDTLNGKLLAQFDAADANELKTKDAEAAKQFERNVEERGNWQKLLDLNEKLKAEAVEFSDFYSSLRAPGKPDPSVDESAADSFVNPTGELLSRFMPREQRSSFEGSAAKTKVGSILFYGDPSGAGLSFALEAGSSDLAESTTEASYERVVGGGATADAIIFAVNVASSTEGTYNWVYHHSSQSQFQTATTNRVAITLADGNLGDVFEVQVFKDRMFGSPVYKVVAGQSRCPREAGTLPREMLELQVQQPEFSHVHPGATVTTAVSIINNSPTGESFTYSLTQLMHTNSHGLWLSINGQPLGSDPTKLQFNVGPGVPVRAMLVAKRPPSGHYDFRRIALQVQGSDGAECAASDARISISYDQPCAQVAWAGPLAVSRSFTINQRSIAASGTGAATLTVVLRNPQFGMQGRSWLELAQSDYLTELEVEFRAADAVSDAEWQPFKRVGDTTPSTPLLAHLRRLYEQDPDSVAAEVLALEWSLSSLADGQYQLRARTQCRVPTGALDTALYAYLTPAITGTLDVTPPKVLGSPLPAFGQWLPGQPIEAVFSKAVACNSYFGRLLVSAWLNPGNELVPAPLGTALRTLHVCDETVVRVELLAPAYELLVGRLVSIRLDNVFDSNGNRVLGDSVQWSFRVTNFDALASPAHADGLRLTASIGQLTQAMGAGATLAKVQQELAAEIAQFVNIVIDADLRPSPAASASPAVGLQAGSVQVSQLTPLPSDIRRTEARLTLHPFPTFPGDEPPRYSPSFFMQQLQGAVAGNTTHTLRLQEVDQYGLPRFPLLRTLAPSSQQQLTMSLTIMQSSDAASGSDSGTLALRRAVHTMALTADAYSPSGVTASSFYVSASTTAVSTTSSVQLSWILQSLPEDAPQIDLAWLSLSFQRLSMASGMDPDEAAALDAAPEITSLSLADASFVRNEQRTSSPMRALYMLQLPTFPTRTGGQYVELRVRVADPASSSGAELYSFTKLVFVKGPPSAPQLLELNQQVDDPRVISVRFLPAQRSGYTLVSDPADVSYELALTDSATNRSFSVPPSLVSLASSRLRFGWETMVASVDLSRVSSATGLPLPTEGRVGTFRVTVRARTASAPSQADSRSIKLYSVAPSLRIQRLAQTDLDQFLLRFKPAPFLDASAVLAYQVAYQGNSSAPLGANGPLVVERVIHVSGMRTLQAVNAQGQSEQQLECTVTLPLSARSSPVGAVWLAMRVLTPAGASPLSWTQVVQPAFVSSPRQLRVSLIRAPSVSNPNLTVSLQWQAPDLLLPAPTVSASLLAGFEVVYSISDGMSLSLQTLPLQLSAADRQVNLTLAHIESPLLSLPTIYTFHVYARSRTSDSLALVARTDGTGVYVLRSQPASVKLELQLPAPDSLSEPLLSARYFLETGGVSTNNLLPPASLELAVEAASEKDSSAAVSAWWPAVNGAASYGVAWYDARSSSTVPLAVQSVSARTALDGMLFARLSPVLLPETDAPFASFKVAVWSVGADGVQTGAATSTSGSASAQRVVSFVSLPPSSSRDTHYTLQVLNYEQNVAPKPLRSAFGYDGFNLTLLWQPVVRLNIRPRSPTLQRLRVVQSSEWVAQIPLLFSSCSPLVGSEAASYAMQRTRAYSVEMAVQEGTPHYVYLELTSESGDVRYSFLDIRNQMLRSLQLQALVDEAQDRWADLSSAMTLPFQPGVTHYGLEVASPLPQVVRVVATLVASAAVALEFPLTLSLDGRTLAVMRSGEPSPAFHIQDMSRIQVGVDREGLYEIAVHYPDSALTGLSLFVPHWAGNDSLQLAAPFQANQLQTAMLLPFRAHSVQIEPTFWAVYSHALLRNASGEVIANSTEQCAAAAAGSSTLDVLSLSSGVRSPALPLQLGVSSFVLCSNKDAPRTLAVVRAPPTVTFLRATLYASQWSDLQPLELDWTPTKADSGVDRAQDYATVVYHEYDTIRLQARFTNLAFPVIPTLSAAQLVLTAVSTTESNVTELLTSGSWSAIYPLHAGSNAFNLDSAADGVYSLGVERLESLSKRALMQQQIDHNSTIALWRFERSEAEEEAELKWLQQQLDAGVEVQSLLPPLLVEISPAFVPRRKFYRASLPFLARFVSLRLLSWALGLVRFEGEVLQSGDESARVPLSVGAQNLTLTSEAGAIYTLQLERRASCLTGIQLQACSDNGENQLCAAADGAFEQSAMRQSFRVPFGASLLRFALSMSNECAALVSPQIVFNNGTTQTVSPGQMLDFPLDRASNKYEWLVRLGLDGEYRVYVDRAAPAVQALLLRGERIGDEQETSAEHTAIELGVEAGNEAAVSASALPLEPAFQPWLQAPDAETRYRAVLPFQFASVRFMPQLVAGSTLELWVEPILADGSLSGEPVAHYQLASHAATSVPLPVGASIWRLRSSVDGEWLLRLERAPADVTGMRCRFTREDGQQLPLPFSFQPGQADYNISLLFAVRSVDCAVQYTTPDSLSMQLTPPTTTQQQQPQVAALTRSAAMVQADAAAADSAAASLPVDVSLDAEVVYGVDPPHDGWVSMPLVVGPSELQLVSATDGLIRLRLVRNLPSPVNTIMRIVAVDANVTAVAVNSSSLAQPLPLQSAFHSFNHSAVVRVPAVQAQRVGTVSLLVRLTEPVISTLRIDQFLGAIPTGTALAAANTTSLSESLFEELETRVATVENLRAAGMEDEAAEESLLDPSQRTWRLIYLPAAQLKQHTLLRVQVSAENNATRNYTLQFSFESVDSEGADTLPVNASFGTFFAAAAIGIALAPLLFLLLAGAGAKMAFLTLLRASGGVRWPLVGVILALLARTGTQFAMVGDQHLGVDSVLLLHALPSLVELAALIAMGHLLVNWCEGKAQGKEVKVPEAPALQAGSASAAAPADVPAPAAASPSVFSLWQWSIVRSVLLHVYALLVVLTAILIALHWTVPRGNDYVVGVVTVIGIVSVLSMLLVVAYLLSTARRVTASGEKLPASAKLLIGASTVLLTACALLLIGGAWLQSSYEEHAVAFRAVYAVLDLVALLLLALLLAVYVRAWCVSQQRVVAHVVRFAGSDSQLSELHREVSVSQLDAHDGQHDDQFSPVYPTPSAGQSHLAPQPLYPSDMPRKRSHLTVPSASASPAPSPSVAGAWSPSAQPAAPAAAAADDEEESWSPPVFHYIDFEEAEVSQAPIDQADAVSADAAPVDGAGAPVSSVAAADPVPSSPADVASSSPAPVIAADASAGSNAVADADTPAEVAPAAAADTVADAAADAADDDGEASVRYVYVSADPAPDAADQTPPVADVAAQPTL